MITVDNCLNFEFSQPLDNLHSLMNVEIDNSPYFAELGDAYIQSIWANETLVAFEVTNCTNASEISSYNKPWEEVN